MSDDTRTVHAEIVSTEFDWKVEIVRYDRAGKWYLEDTTNGKTKRTAVTLSEAVDYFRRMRDSSRLTSTHYGGRHGGSQFDGRLRKAAQR